MRILVLGGAGFMGSHLVDALVVKNHTVSVLEKTNVNKENLGKSINAIKVIEGDFQNKGDLDRAVRGIDVVVHLIGTTIPSTSNMNPIYDVQSNVLPSLSLLNLCVEFGVKKVIFASSGGTIYGIPRHLPIGEDHPTNPTCSYGITKLTIEKFLHLYHVLHDLDYTVLRISNPYGERQRIDSQQGAIAVFLGSILSHKKITIWGDGSVSRDFIYVTDVITAFLRVIEEEAPSKIYNVGSGKSYSLNDILSTMKSVTGEEPLVDYDSERKFDVPVNYLDVSRANKELNWKPSLALEEGIQRTHDWIRKQGLRHKA